MISIQNVKLVDLLPPSVAQDPNVLAAAAALDGELQAVTEAISQCILLARIDELDEPVLDVLAWESHVDYFDPGLPIETKRELVRKSIAWHRRKGTPAAVEELITAVFGDGKVVEWFEYGGEPYKFKVQTYSLAATGEQAEEFLAALNSVKNARSWLELVEVIQSEEMALYFGCAVYCGDNLTVEQVV